MFVAIIPQILFFIEKIYLININTKCLLRNIMMKNTLVGKNL